jgi:hypothetical protein
MRMRGQTVNAEDSTNRPLPGPSSSQPGGLAREMTPASVCIPDALLFLELGVVHFLAEAVRLWRRFHSPAVTHV